MAKFKDALSTGVVGKTLISMGIKDFSVTIENLIAMGFEPILETTVGAYWESETPKLLKQKLDKRAIPEIRGSDDTVIQKPIQTQVIASIGRMLNSLETRFKNQEKYLNTLTQNQAALYRAVDDLYKSSESNQIKRAVLINEKLDLITEGVRRIQQNG